MSDRSAVDPHRFYGIAAAVLGALAIAIGILELAGLPPLQIGAAMLLGSILAYMLAAWLSRQAPADRFHLGGGGLPPFYLGLAGSVDWLGTLFLLAVPAMLYTQGAIGLAVMLGGAAGYVLAGLVLAAGLARSGRLTAADFLAARYQSEAVRRFAAVAFAGIGIGFALAQTAALAHIGARLFGLDVRLIHGVIVVAVLACVLPGGATTGLRAQVVQAMVALLGFVLPALILSARFTGLPLPQLAYGPVVQRVETMAAAFGGGGSLVSLSDPWVFVGIVACLAFGVATLPHVLSRHLAAPDARSARRVVGWTLLLVALALTTAPAYATFVKSEVLANILGQPISALPKWVAGWSGLGVVGACDATAFAWRNPLCAGAAGDGNGLVDAAEFRLLPEAIVLVTPSIADLPVVITALAVAALTAAALGAIGGALVGAASTLAVDLARRPQSVAAMRLAIIAVVALTAGLAAALEIDGLRLGLSMLALGACGLFPALAFGIWSRRRGGAAALAGMLTGFLFCLVMLAGGALAPRPESLSLGRIAVAMLGLPLGFSVLWLVSRFGAPGR